MTRVLLLFASLGLAGCSLLVADKVDPIQPNLVPDLRLEMIGMDPHIGQLTDIFLVSNANVVQARAIYDPLPGPSVTLELDNVVAPNVRRIDFYSDLNMNRMLDPSVPDPVEPGRRLFPDHMWRREVDEHGFLLFMHNTDFVDLTETPANLALRPLRVMLSGADPFAGQPAQVWVSDPSDREVGYYYLGRIAGDAIDVAIDGIVDEGTDYLVEIEVGGTTRCFRGRGTAAGLDVTGALTAIAPCEGN